MLSLPGFDAEVDADLAPGQGRRLSVHRRGTWRALENGNTWAWRDGAGLLAKDDGLYLLGGWNSDSGPRNDVWFTRDLVRWTLRLPSAPWQGRHGAGWVVHDKRLWVIGGDLHDDAWSSADGIDWRLEYKAAGYGKRYTPMAVPMLNRLLVFGGQAWGPSDWCAFDSACYTIAFNDTWSAYAGQTWTQVQPQAPWAGRGLIHGTPLFQGRVYLIGGGLKIAPPGGFQSETIEERNDIWSSVDGVHWTLEKTAAAFSPRTHHAVLATADGCYVAGGSIGQQLNTTNEVWFAPNCLDYRLLPGSAAMGARHAASLAEFNGSLIVLGGHRDTAGTLVWQYFPER